MTIDDLGICVNLFCFVFFSFLPCFNFHYSFSKLTLQWWMYYHAISHCIFTSNCLNKTKGCHLEASLQGGVFLHSIMAVMHVYTCIICNRKRVRRSSLPTPTYSTLNSWTWEKVFHSLRAREKVREEGVSSGNAWKMMPWAMFPSQ